MTKNSCLGETVTEQLKVEGMTPCPKTHQAHVLFIEDSITENHHGLCGFLIQESEPQEPQPVVER